MWTILEQVMEKMKTIGALCLAGMALLTCVDVVGRFFRHPILGSVELVGFMAALAVAMALPFTDRDKGHVGVEIIVRMFSKKTRTAIDICTRFLSLSLIAVLTWQMAVYARTMQTSGEVSISLELPEYIIIYTTSFCCLILCLTILKDLINNFKKLKEK